MSTTAVTKPAAKDAASWGTHVDQLSGGAGGHWLDHARPHGGQPLVLAAAPTTPGHPWPGLATEKSNKTHIG